MDPWTSAEASAQRLRNFVAPDGADPRSDLSRPRMVAVLGSGLGGVCDALEDTRSIGFNELPGFASTSVVGHQGRFWAGRIASEVLWILQGRVHLYEGHSPSQVVHGVRSALLAGAPAVLLTNAAGGCNPEFRVGDFMVITDHINLSGANPLVGPSDQARGLRFPHMGRAWNPDLARRLLAAGRVAGAAMRRGVYAGLRGPSYETAAEVSMLRGMHADAVGMSTVLEAVAVTHFDQSEALRRRDLGEAHRPVLLGGISVISNMAEGLGDDPLAHADVERVAGRAARDLTALLRALLPELAAAP
jgi:purine-nucleoside phosphorylase